MCHTHNLICCECSALCATRTVTICHIFGSADWILLLNGLMTAYHVYRELQIHPFMQVVGRGHVLTLVGRHVLTLVVRAATHPSALIPSH